MSRLQRQTGETRVIATVTRGGGANHIETSEPFLTHMVTTLARYAGLSIELSAAGDLRHHLVEDVAITLGLALTGAAGCTQVTNAYCDVFPGTETCCARVPGRVWNPSTRTCDVRPPPPPFVGPFVPPPS